MKYRALAESLIPVAEAVRKHFMSTEAAKRFRAEEEVAASLLYRPTLLGESQDSSLLAIEVNEGAYTTALDDFVLECLREAIAIRLFVAAPEGGPDSERLNLVRKAKARGIGVLEVRGSVVKALTPALSLSLFGLRPIERREFPKQTHAQLTQAEETFLNGDPVKGCGRIYDLVENRSRAIAIEIGRLGLWRPLSPGEKRPRVNLKQGAWARVLEVVDEHADFSQLQKHDLTITKALWGRLRGLPPHRNQSGHEARTREELQSRNRELRTRFEHAVDTLRELTGASPRIVS